MFVLSLVAGCGGKTYQAINEQERRGFDFGDNSHFVSMRAGESFKTDGLLPEDQMLTLIADLVRQRMLAKGIKVGSIQQFVGFEELRRTGRTGLFEIGLGGGGHHPGLGHIFSYRRGSTFLSGGGSRTTPLVVLQHYPSEEAAIQSGIQKEDERVAAFFKKLNRPSEHVKEVLSHKVRPLLIRGQYANTVDAYEGIQKELTPLIDEWVDQYIDFIRKSPQRRP